MTDPKANDYERDFEDEENDGHSVALSNPTVLDDDDSNLVGTKSLEQEERKTLARRETQAVGYTRILVYLVVLITAISVSLVVYFYTKRDQQEDFETQFAAYAAKVAESFYDAVERKVGAVATFSTTITSYAGK